MNLREWALPVYTVLMQMAIGGFAALWILRAAVKVRLERAELDRLIQNPLIILFTTVVVAMIGSHFHLSRPYLSFLAILNFRSSWLSREIVFTVLTFSVIASLSLLQVTHRGREPFLSALGWVGIALGSAAIYCMSRIYLLPTQVSWNTPITVYTFYSTAVLLGSMAMAAILVINQKFLEIHKVGDATVRAGVVRQALCWLAGIAFGMLWVVVALNVFMVLSLRSAGGIAQISLELLLGLYQPLWILRLLVLLVGVGWLVETVVTNVWKRTTSRDLTMPVYIACLLVMIGEILGRFLFYATHVKMGI